MKNYQLVTYSNPQDVHFAYKTAAFLASVSTQFLHQCEDEDLITCRIMVHGQKGLCFADVQKLKLIRHLHEDMGMTLEEVDFLLRYRDRLKTLQGQLNEMKQQMCDHKRTYEAEIQTLRRRLVQLYENNVL